MNKPMSYLRSALQESPGVDSSIRLVMFLCACLVMLSGLVWLFLSVWVTLHAEDNTQRGLLKIDSSVWTFLSALLSISITGKIVQYFKEPANQTAEQPPTS
jgi:hypothetical protein